MIEALTRVCIVGAGAVALVYARYLQNAGAEVSLLVKPQYRDACRKGFQLHHFGYRGRIRDEQLVISQILTHVDEVAEEPSTRSGLRWLRMRCADHGSMSSSPRRVRLQWCSFNPTSTTGSSFSSGSKKRASCRA